MKGDTQFFRATSPLPRGTLKSKGGGQLSIHICADQGTIEIVFRTIISVNQLSIYPTPSTDDPAQEVLLLNYQERVDKLPQQNRVIKFCTDAGFLTTVDVGQYIMTKDIEEFSLFTEPVTCREYTLPRDEISFDPKGWI